MSFGKSAQFKRLRGAVLKLLQTNHDAQNSRFDITALWSVLYRNLKFDCSRNEVKTCLQDLSDRKLVKFEQVPDLDNGKIDIVRIELCPQGRDILEGTIEDPAVEL